MDIRDETNNYIISKYRKQPQREYKTRHDWADKRSMANYAKKLKFDHTIKWFVHKPESSE